MHKVYLLAKYSQKLKNLQIDQIEDRILNLKLYFRQILRIHWILNYIQKGKR